MAYTCAVYPSQTASLEEAQFAKHDLVARKIGLRPGMRLLDVGCGWGGMVMHAAAALRGAGAGRDAVPATGRMGDRRPSPKPACPSWPRCATSTTATSRRPSSTPISSIGLTEHIGVKQLPAYFAFLYRRLRPGGRLLNHCITVPDNDGRRAGGRASSAGTSSRTASSPASVASSPPCTTTDSKCGTRRTCASTTRSPRPGVGGEPRRELG